jgi:hypothetical protein
MNGEVWKNLKGEAENIQREILAEKTDITNSMEQSSSGRLVVTQLVKKFPTFYETQGLITVFTKAYPEPDESSPQLYTQFP